MVCIIFKDHLKKKNQLKKLDELKSVLLKINFLSEADETNFYNYFS